MIKRFIELHSARQVVNKAELSAMESAGLPFYALNVAVSLAIPIPGFRSDISSALVRDMPFGALTLVRTRP